MTKPKFTPTQPVTLVFTDGNRLDAVIVEECDPAKMVPLTDYWMVRVVCEGGLGRAFGFKGAAIEARA